MLSRSPSPARSRSPSPALELDPNTLALLNNFYSERTQLEEEFAALEAKAQARLDQAQAGEGGAGPAERMSVDEFRRLFGEDWQLSQFWYSAAFTRRLSHFISTLIPATATVAFLSSPTGYVGFTHEKPEYASVKLLEFDERFGIVGGNDFFKWDLNNPLEGIDALEGKVDFAVIDPPFLNEVTNEAFATALSHLLTPSTGRFLILTSTSVTNLSNIYRPLLQPNTPELVETSDRLQVSHAGGIANGFGSWLSWRPEPELLEKALDWKDDQ